MRRAASGAGRNTEAAAVALCWAATRALLLLWVFRVWVVPGPDVTTDVDVIYRGWYETLSTGSFPVGDVAWQYPPGAALAVLSPGLLPFLDYAHAFFLLALLADLAVTTLLLAAGGRSGRSTRGVWMWIGALPLLGPTAFARYDVMVTALAVAALLAGARRPQALGILAALAALVKVWPVMLLLGTPRGRHSRLAWVYAAASAAAVSLAFAVSMPGSWSFLTAQRDRGTEVESLGALVFHVARQFGWSGRIELHYGSMEFLGPGVAEVSAAAQLLTAAAVGWLLWWRIRARTYGPSTLADAAFTAVLLFTVTSRVISPQYMIWLVGLAAVCLLYRGSRMTVPALLVLAATAVTGLEFPIWFVHVIVSDARGLVLMFLRNGLLVAACLLAGRALWRQTVPRAGAGSGAGDAAAELPLQPPGRARRPSPRGAGSSAIC